MKFSDLVFPKVTVWLSSPLKHFSTVLFAFSDKYIIYNTTKQNHCLHLNDVLPLFFFLFFEKYLLKKFCLLPHLFSTSSADFNIYPQPEIQKQVSIINLPLSSQFACMHNLIRISIFYIWLLFTFLQVFKFLQTNYDYQYFHSIYIDYVSYTAFYKKGQSPRLYSSETSILNLNICYKYFPFLSKLLHNFPSLTII